MAPDCYAALGVSRDANLCQIRRVFRELSRRFDPDHADDPRPFQQVERAYDTLGAPTERAAHDRALAAESGTSEPAPMLSAPRDVVDDYADHRPSRDEVIRAFDRAFLGPHPKARPVREVRIDVLLSPEQTASGGVIPFTVPAATPCHACGGSGRSGFFHCDACGGNGATWTRARVDVVVPRSAQSGMKIPVSLTPVGAGSMFLNVAIHARADETSRG